MELFNTLTCLIIGAAVLWAIRWLRLLSSSGSSSKSPSQLQYTHICPHCGSLTTAFASKEPSSWTCSECACHYSSDGQISADTLDEYKRIDTWEGLADFINKAVELQQKKEGFISLKDGVAYFNVAGSHHPFASYPTHGINRAGELHLMYLCMMRCKAHCDELGISKYMSFWLMEHGFAWESTT